MKHVRFLSFLVFFAIGADGQPQIVVMATFWTQLGFTKFAIFEVFDQGGGLAVFAGKTSFQAVGHLPVFFFGFFLFPFIFKELLHSSYYIALFPSLCIPCTRKSTVLILRFCSKKYNLPIGWTATVF